MKKRRDFLEEVAPDELNEIKDYWELLNNHNYSLSKGGMTSIKRFIYRGSSLEDMKLAMDMAVEKVPETDIEGRFKYFCGIIWKTLEQDSGLTSACIKKDH